MDPLAPIDWYPSIGDEGGYPAYDDGGELSNKLFDERYNKEAQPDETALEDTRGNGQRRGEKEIIRSGFPGSGTKTDQVQAR